MASRPNVKTRPLTRDKLAQFLGNHELIKTFENITNDVSQVLPDATQAASQNADAALALATALKALEFILLSGSTSAPNARTLQVGSGLTLTDNGAGGALLLDLALSAAGAVLAGDVTESATQFTDAPGLVLALQQNASYALEGIFGFQASAGVPCMEIGFTLPAGASITGRCGNNITAGPLVGASGTASVTPASGPTNTITGQWLITTGSAAGNAQLRFRTLLDTFAVTMKAGQCAIFARRIK